MPSRTTKSGFTIIEVLIVLAIASLVLAVILIATSSLGASARDNLRKDQARQIYSSLLEFAGYNNGKFPACDSGVPAHNCNLTHQNGMSKFLTQYIGNIMDPDTGRPLSGSEFVSSNQIVRTTARTFVYVADAGLVDHTAMPNLDSVLIVSGHWCASTLSNGAPDSNPLGNHSAPAGTPDLKLNKFAIIIGTEKNRYYCIDNY